jgi:hypothetical protein
MHFSWCILLAPMAYCGMDSAPLPDLDALDREALLTLLTLLHAHQQQLRSLAAAHEDELRSLEMELESHRQTLSQQDDQLRSSSEHIEHLKLIIEKLKRRMFGVRSEKIVVQLEQLELHLEELETTQAEMQAAVERVAPVDEPKDSIPAQAAARSSPARGGHASSPPRRLSRLRRPVAPVRRRYLRATGVHPGQLQGHSPCAAEVRLQRM